MSTAIGCLLCNNRCSIDRVVSQFAFFPPSPASYTMEAHEGKLRIRFCDPEMAAAHENLQRNAAGGAVRVDCARVETSRGSSVALLHFVHPAARATLLWSHGNAMDIGEMYFFLLGLAAQMGVSVRAPRRRPRPARTPPSPRLSAPPPALAAPSSSFLVTISRPRHMSPAPPPQVLAYDYSGYGASSGAPSEANCYADIQAAHDYLRSRGVDSSSLLLYGQSVGSAPSLWLAARCAVAGVVLHTPLMSGLRVLIPPHGGCCSLSGCCNPVCVYSLCDPFPNLARIKKVRSPVLLLHGTHDSTVDKSHTDGLYARVPQQHRRPPYIVPGANHDNLVEANPDGYFDALEAFLSEAVAQGRGAGRGAPSGAEAPLAPVPTSPMARS